MSLPLPLLTMILTRLRVIKTISPSPEQSHLAESVDSTKKGYADTAINANQSIPNRTTNATYSVISPIEAVRTHLPGLVLDLSALIALVADLNLVTETQESVRMTSVVRNRCDENEPANHRPLVTLQLRSSSSGSK